MQRGQSFGSAARVGGVLLCLAGIAVACTTQTGFENESGPGPHQVIVDGGDYDATSSNTKSGTLELDISTGSDSLRMDSTATATIFYQGGVSETITLPEYNNPDDGGMVLNFTEGSTTTILSDIHYAAPITSIQIALTSHPIPDVESQDSWIITEVNASETLTGGSNTCVLQQPGATVTDNQPVTVQALGCAKAGALDLLIITGSDDLRSDSTASVTVNYQGGESDVVPLTNSYPAGSTVDTTIARTSAQPITSLVIAMQSHPQEFESADDWVISQVVVYTTGGPDAGAPTCIINALGASLTDGVQLTVTPGGCPSDVDAGPDNDAGDAATD